VGASSSQRGPTVTSSSNSSRLNCTGNLLVWSVPILARVVIEVVDQAIHDSTGVQKVRQRSQGARFTLALGDLFKVGPRSWDQALRTIRQDEAQLEAVVPVHRAQYRELLALEGMVGSHDAHLFRKVPDVGSVSPTPSTRSTTRPSWTGCGIESGTGVSWGW